MIKFNSKTFQFNFATFLFTLAGKLFYTGSLYGTKYFRMDQINFFKSCLPQTFLGPFLNTLSHIFGSSHPKVFCKKGVLRNFAKFTGTHLCQSLFLMKFTKETLAEVFSCEFCKSSKNILFYRKPPVVASVNRKFDP